MAKASEFKGLNCLGHRTAESGPVSVVSAGLSGFDDRYESTYNCVAASDAIADPSKTAVEHLDAELIPFAKTDSL